MMLRGALLCHACFPQNNFKQAAGPSGPKGPICKVGGMRFCYRGPHVVLRGALLCHVRLLRVLLAVHRNVLAGCMTTIHKIIGLSQACKPEVQNHSVYASQHILSNKCCGCDNLSDVQHLSTIQHSADLTCHAEGGRRGRTGRTATACACPEFGRICSSHYLEGRLFSPAMLSAPPTRPERPDSTSVRTSSVPPPTPIISDATDTRPSLAPRTPVR